MEKEVEARGLEVENPVERLRRRAAFDQRNECPEYLRVFEVALPENEQHVLDPRS